MKPKFVDFRQLENYANFMKHIGWRVIDISNLFSTSTKQFGYLYKIPHLNIKLLQLHRVNPDIDLHKLESFIKKTHIYSLRMGFNVTTQDPNSARLVKALDKLGFKQIPWCNSPTKTLLISLGDHSPNQYLKSLKPKTRYNIRLAKKKKVIVKKFNSGINPPPKDMVKQFWYLVKETSKSNGIPYLSYQQFNCLLKNLKSSAQLFLAQHKNQIIAGVLFIETKKTLYYTLNGSSSMGKRLFAPTLLVWVGINHVSTHSIQNLDFEGIIDERNPELTSTWKGFSRFKQSFLGTPVSYMMPYEKTYSSVYHKIISIVVGKHYSQILPSIYPTRVNFFNF